MPCVPLLCIRDYNLLAWRMNSTPRCHWAQTSFCCCLTACQHLKVGRFWPKKQHSRANWIWPLKWRKLPACRAAVPLNGAGALQLVVRHHHWDKMSLHFIVFHTVKKKVKNRIPQPLSKVEKLRTPSENGGRVCLQNPQIPVFDMHSSNYIIT